MSRSHKFRVLTSPERWLLCQSLVALPLTKLGLKVLGFQRWQNALDRIPSTGQSATAGMSLSARQIARLVRAAANHGLHRANCLEQSMVLCWLLKRHGLESRIRFGARKEDDQLLAHAWVELEGMALNEAPGVDQRYAPFAGVTPKVPSESR